MFEAIKAWVLRFLRVPAEPTAPEGGRVIRVFRAGPMYFRYKLAFWALRQLATAVGLVGGLLFVAMLRREIPYPAVDLILALVEGFAWAAFLAQLPFSFAVLRLDYEMRWYILSDRSLRIREGILSVREKTLTFANIQQVSIQQNPLQRLLGLADVRVATAGGGSGGPHGQGVGESMHEAFFRGVDNADEIRGVIAERVRLHRDTGLGDPDEPEPLAPAAAEPQVLAAAHELHREIRELRRAFASAPAA